MTSKLAHFLATITFALSVTALAQTSSSAAALPAAPSATAAPAGMGTKIATLNIQQAIFASNEGQREADAVGKKLEPKETELKSMNDEIEALKKQLNVQEGKLSEEAHSNLVNQISQKQKVFDRSMQDARDDFQNQQQEIAQKILQKLAPVIKKYTDDNGYGLLIDTSNPWPQGPVIMTGPSFDITKEIVDAYNAQSGVAAPAAGSRPARPAGSASKPAGATTPAK